jgi:hypothetical protein
MTEKFMHIKTGHKLRNHDIINNNNNTNNVHTVTAGLSGESVTRIGPITCFCIGSASDAFVSTPCFVALVLCRVKRPVW